MTLALLSLGAAIVLVMVALSQYGWRVLPEDARVPLNWGPGSRGLTPGRNWIPKRTALLAYPGIGLLVYLIASAMLAAHRKQELAGVPLALLLVSFAQYRAIGAARSAQPS